MRRRKPCTCVGVCRGAEGLGAGWACVLELDAEARQTHWAADVKQDGRDRVDAELVEELVAACRALFAKPAVAEDPHHEYTDEDAALDRIRGALQRIEAVNADTRE